MRKVTTGCCALCQIDQVNNETSIEDLQFALSKLKEEKEKNTEVGITTGNGQSAVFIIVSPGEYKLESNLKLLGFELKHNFPRRKGYNEVSSPAFQGDLKMYIKNI